jgi:exosortase D (VPLPA-CTERM-specific)
MGLLYHQTIFYLFTIWRKEDFNYGYVILPIVLYLLWEKRAELKRCPSVPSWRGLIPIGVGIFLYALGELGGEFTTLFLSLWLVVFGLCWLHLGWGKLKVISFPVAFLLVMFPPPNLIYGNLSLRLQLISSQVGVWMIRVFGMTAYREGNVIDLGFTQLQVVDACSGLRYLFPLLALGILIAYHFRASFWKRAVLVLSAVPVTVFTNSLRIATVGFLYPVWGAKVAEGFFHDFSGWLIFMVSLAILLAEMWLLGRIFPEPERSAVVNEGPALSDGIPIEEKSGVPQGRRWGPPQSVVAVVLLLATVLVFRNVEFRQKVPVSRPLAQVSLSMGEWIGDRKAMEQIFLDTLKLTDYAIVDYRDPNGKEINVYVAYNDRQVKGESSHSPDSCLPGSGWVFHDSGTVVLPVQAGDGQPMRVKRALMEKSGARQLAYYWFPQRGRILTNMFQLKAYAFWDALTRRRTDGALVRLITPVYETEQLTDAETRLQAFTRDLVPVLDRFLPGKE